MQIKGCVCFGCKWFLKDKDGMTCEAFPIRIPDEITKRGNDHKKPIKGDNDIQFTPKR